MATAPAAVSANRAELIAIADAVAREKLIDKGIVIEAMEDAIQRAARARYGAENDIRAKLDAETGDLRLWRVLEVVEEPEDHFKQVDLKGAQKLKKDAQLGDFIVYKAKRAGVPVVFVDPAYTSQQCSECDQIDNKNRASQSLFICRNCGVVAHADRNASRNIARKGEAVWTAGRESRVSATPQGCLDGGDHPAASWALPPSPVL